MTTQQSEFLERLYREYFPRLMIYVMASLPDKDKAQDIVQDTFHEAVRHIDNLFPHENPGGWLVLTAKFKLKEYHRAQRRMKQNCLSLDSGLPKDFISSREPPFESRVEFALLLQSLQGRLSKEERHLLKRLVFDEASHLEVAKELGITVWTCQKRYERLKKKLQKML